MTADFKEPKRVEDRGATRRALLAHPSCLACGYRATNGHHVLPVGRGATGDDLLENIVGLCGSGATGCHGAWHGSPYVCKVWTLALTGEDAVDERRDREWVSRRIGARLARERPDVVAYVKRKLGPDAGADFLRRVYYLEG